MRRSLPLAPLVAATAIGLGLAVRVQAQAAPIRAARAARPPAAVSPEAFALVTNVRALPGGMVLVNDVIKHRVVLLDSALALVRVVVDSANNPANYYGARPGGLIAYRGDSTLFVDAGDLTMMMIDPKGAIARVMSVPSTQDAAALASTSGALPGLDGAGRLVYRNNARMVIPGLAKSTGAGGAAASVAAALGSATATTAGGSAASGSATGTTAPDTAAIQRVDIATRKVDTAAFVRVPKSGMTVTQSPNGGITMTSQLNPLPLLDEWAVMDDGSIAIVRGQDYHIDWITADGKKMSSAKIPFDWQRLTDDGKVALIDSAKKARDAQPAAGGQPMSIGGGAPVVLNSILGGNGQPIVTGKTVSVGGGGGGGAQVMTFGTGGGAGMSMPQMDFIPAADLPDYRPAFSTGAARGDRDGNLWVQTSAPTKGGGPIYDVISRQGELVDRIQLDVGRTVVGFAPGGVVYLLARTDLGTHLERARVK